MLGKRLAHDVRHKAFGVDGNERLGSGCIEWIELLEHLHTTKLLIRVIHLGDRETTSTGDDVNHDWSIRVKLGPGTTTFGKPVWLLSVV